MGINDLVTIGNLTPTLATGEILDQYAQALIGDVVPRNNSGSAQDVSGSLGSSAFQFDKIYIKNGLVVDGQTIDLDSIDRKTNGILSGKKKTSGYPQFLSVVSASVTAKIDTNEGVDPLSLIINSSPLTISADDTFLALSVAPSIDNTITVNDTTLTGQEWTGIVGEMDGMDRELNVGPYSLEVDAVQGTVQVFKFYNGIDTEYALCEIDADRTILYPFIRGLGSTPRITLNNNDTLTLMKANYLFIELSGPTNHSTTIYPIYSDSTPAGAVSGQWYYDTDLNSWYRYSGSSWEAKNALWMGIAILDDIETVAVVNNDFDLAFKSECEYSVEYKNTDSVFIKLKSVNVAGSQIKTINNRGVTLALSDSNNREAGVSEISSTSYYIYVKPSGKCVFSNKAPRMIDQRLGFYHPDEYWRCISWVFNNSSSDLVDFSDITNQSQIIGITPSGRFTRATFDGAANSIEQSLNIYSLSKPSTGKYLFTFIRPYKNLTYTITTGSILRSNGTYTENAKIAIESRSKDTILMECAAWNLIGDTLGNADINNANITIIGD